MKKYTVVKEVDNLSFLYIFYNSEKADMFAKEVNSFVEVKEVGALICAVTVDSPFSPVEDRTGLIKLGSIPRDSRCTGYDTYYTSSEERVEGKRLFNEKKQQMKSAVDSYYSQPWV